MLQKSRYLLVLDNLDSKAKSCVGDRQASKSEQIKLARFLSKLRGKQTLVIIASRNPENLEPATHNIYYLAGLDSLAASEYTMKLLDRKGIAAPAYLDNNFGDSLERLIDLLHRNPAAMTAIMPLLSRYDISTLLRSYVSGTCPFELPITQGRRSHVFRAISEALEERQKDLLVCLIHVNSFLRVDLLHFLVESVRRHRTDSIDSDVPTETQQLLQRLVDLGVVQYIEATTPRETDPSPLIFEIHPLLSLYLRNSFEKTCIDSNLTDCVKEAFIEYHHSRFDMNLVMRRQAMIGDTHLEIPNFFSAMTLATTEERFNRRSCKLRAMVEHLVSSAPVRYAFVEDYLQCLIGERAILQTEDTPELEQMVGYLDVCGFLCVSKFRWGDDESGTEWGGKFLDLGSRFEMSFEVSPGVTITVQGLLSPEVVEQVEEYGPVLRSLKSQRFDLAVRAICSLYANAALVAKRLGETEMEERFSRVYLQDALTWPAENIMESWVRDILLVRAIQRARLRGNQDVSLYEEHFSNSRTESLYLNPFAESLRDLSSDEQSTLMVSSRANEMPFAFVEGYPRALETQHVKECISAGDVLLEAGDRERAQSHFEEGLEISTKCNLTAYLLPLYWRLTSIAMQEENWSQTRALAIEGMKKKGKWGDGFIWGVDMLEDLKTAQTMAALELKLFKEAGRLAFDEWKEGVRLNLSERRWTGLLRMLTIESQSDPSSVRVDNFLLLGQLEAVLGDSDSNHSRLGRKRFRDRASFTVFLRFLMVIFGLYIRRFLLWQNSSNARGYILNRHRNAVNQEMEDYYKDGDEVD